MDNHRYLFSTLLLESYLELFAEFGPPKELLVVAGNGEAPDITSSRLPELKKIGLSEDPYIHESRKSEGILQYIHDNWYYKREDVSWFRERLPDVKIVGVKTDAETWSFRGEGPKLLALGDETARYWQNMEYELHGREWNFDIDGSPYGRDNMNKALAGAKSDRYLARLPEII